MLALPLGYAIMTAGVFHPPILCVRGEAKNLVIAVATSESHLGANALESRGSESMNGGGGVNLGLGAVSGRNEYLRKFKQDKKSLTEYRTYRLHTHSQIMLNPNWATSEARLNNSCSAYVSKVDFGIELTIAISIRFAHESSKESFTATVKSSALFGLIDLGTSTTTTHRTISQYEISEFTLSAFQLGGSKDQLDQIFGGGESRSKTCPLTSLGPCIELLARLDRYRREIFTMGTKQDLAIIETYQTPNSLINRR